MNKVVLIVGDGELARLVDRELSSHCRMIRTTDLLEIDKMAEHIDVALVLDDGWDPAVHQLAESRFRQRRIPWIRGFVSLGEGMVGPFVKPDARGCSQCADLRRWMAGGDRPEMWHLRQSVVANAGTQGDAWGNTMGYACMAQILVAEVNRYFRAHPLQTQSGVYLVHLKTLKTTRHSFLPDPHCPVCGGVPDDTEDGARISLRPSPKVSHNSYRTREAESLDSILDEFLDYKTGFLNGKMHDLVSPFAAASVNLPLTNGDEGCAGRTHSYAESELTAALEALERYCGLTPRGKRTVVRNTYDEVKAYALNPVTVGVHEPVHYALPNFPFHPFQADMPMEWVWGYSFLQGRPILVPKLLAYYSLACDGGFVYETSNGCALGGSLEEAIFYGIMEVVERDAFLMTWYAKLPLTRIRVESGDAELRMMADRLKAVSGYDVLLFDATMENGIPAVWAMAKSTRKEGVNLICAAGAHLDPLRAAKGAIHELAGMVLTMNDKFESSRAHCLKMYQNPYEVRGMEDHSLLYSLPEAEERFDFLLKGNQPTRSFAEAYPTRPWHTDLTDDLREILQAFRKLNLDVLVVDQTAPEVRKHGLYCVKVLIPGMLPMTFGYHLTRLEGLDRVLRVPAELGFAKKPLTRGQLNPHPHPFP